jgi:fluoroquinolone resistance protein
VSAGPAEVRGADWYGEDLSGQEHTRVAFSGVDLSESTDDGAVFTECTFRDCKFNLSRHTGPPS